MILGPKTEKVIKIIIDEGPQHISKIKKRLGSGSKQSIDYLKKVGVLKRDEQTDVYSLSSTIYTDLEEVMLRIVAWRAEMGEAGESPIPPTMLDSITAGMASLGVNSHHRRAQEARRHKGRRRILDRISVRTPRREGTPGRSPRTRTSPGPLLCTLRRNQTMEVRQ